MTKMRVHELAKELNMENREILDMLKARNIEVKNHMSTLEDDVTESIRKEVQGRRTAERRQRLRKKSRLRRRKTLLLWCVRRIPGTAAASRENVRASARPVRLRKREGEW